MIILIMINKKDKLNYLFQKIEQNKVTEVREFFQHFPEFKDPSNKEFLRSINDWSPVYYCARYGYYELLRFFFEELGISEEINFLLLLSIHSGSLQVINYLFNQSKSPSNDLVMPLYSSCNLGKINVGVYMMLRGSMVLDDDTYDGSSETSPKLICCYNMSFSEEAGLKKYFDRDNKLLYEETQNDLMQPLTQRKICTDRKILILSTSRSRVREKKKIVSIFRQFNFDLLREMKKLKVEQKKDAEFEAGDGENQMEIEVNLVGKTNYFEILETVEKSEYLKKIWIKYLECKGGSGN